MSRATVRLMNVALCLAVIYIHVASLTLGQLNRAGYAYAVLFALSRLSACVVQGFVLLSAYKLTLKYSREPFRYGAFLRGRLLTVGVPYLVWSVVYYVYFCSLGYYTFSVAELAGFIVLGKAAGQMYFVPMIWQFYLLMPLWLYIVKRAHPALLIALSLMVTVICGQFLPDICAALGIGGLRYNDRLFTTYFAYWIIGMCAAYHADAFAQVMKSKVTICVVCVIAAALDVTLSYRANVTGVYAPYLENLHVLYCLSAIPALAILCDALRRVADTAVVRVMDGASYYIYLTHVILIYMCQEWFAAHSIYSTALTFLWRTIIVYIVSITVCCIYVIIKNAVVVRMTRVTSA